MVWILVNWWKRAPTVYLIYYVGGRYVGLLLNFIEKMLMGQALTPSHGHTNQANINSLKSPWKTAPGIYFNENISYWEKFLSGVNLDT